MTLRRPSGTVEWVQTILAIPIWAYFIKPISDAILSIRLNFIDNVLLHDLLVHFIEGIALLGLYSVIFILLGIIYIKLTKKETKTFDGE